ncbi:MAG: caspase domain-containing protein [Rubripirellula sp.]
MIFRSLMAVLVASICLPIQAEPPRVDPKQTHALIVGVLQWQERSLTTYPKMKRQDVALRDQLVEMGVPKSNLTLLLDQKATRSTIYRALEQLTESASSESTLIVYYAGHGMLNDQQGVFANYDIQTNRMASTGWCLNDMASQICKSFQGKRVLLFADCCFSGALSSVARQLNESGIAAASLTSASPSNTSTNNWTYTMSLIDLLRGQSLADRNRDGMISISEAGTEIEQAMSIHENQASGFSLFGVDQQFVLAPVQKATYKSDRLTPFSRGQYVQAREGRKWAAARILDFDGTRLAVQFQEYNSRRVAWVPETNLRVSSTLTPKLSKEEALTKASVDGKYSKLLRTIKVKQDLETYGPFHEWGKWNQSSWGGHQGLPAGYWVYVYPRWYIWDVAREPIHAE